MLRKLKLKKYLLAVLLLILSHLSHGQIFGTQSYLKAKRLEAVDSLRLRGIWYKSLGGGLDSVRFNSSQFVDTLVEYGNFGTTVIGLIDRGTGIIRGGIVTHDSGYTYSVTACDYIINSGRYHSNSGSIVLDSSFGGQPRFDVIAVDSTGSIVKITGVPASNPTVPQIDAGNQLALATILIPSGGSGVDPSITKLLIYDEHNTPPEWNPVGSPPGLYADSTYPQVGAVAIKFPLTIDGRMVFTGSNTQVSAYNNLRFNLRLQAAIDRRDVNIVLYNSANSATSNRVAVTAAHGLVKTTVGSYQNITVPLSSFSITGNEFNQIVIEFTTNAARPVTVYLDNIFLQGGIAPPNPTTNYVSSVFKKPGTDSVFYVRNNVNYFAFKDSVGAGGGSSGWSLTGNTGTNPATNFIGTTDNQPLSFKINNQKAGYLGVSNNNSIYGYLAGDSLTSAQYTIAIGSQALRRAKTNSGNIGIGYRAMFNQKAGTYNTAIGYGTFEFDTAGIQNVVVGTAALRYQGKANYNSVFGYEAMKNVGGAIMDHNVAIGTLALSRPGIVSNPTADSLYGNTAVGDGAGTTMSRGKFNTYIGSTAGANGSYPQNRNYSIAIGSGAIGEEKTLSFSDSVKFLRLKLRNYGDGKVLTSDANGYAEWRTPTGGSAGDTLFFLDPSKPLKFIHNVITGTDTLLIDEANPSQAGYLTAAKFNEFAAKQPALVSGVNIKTINGASLLGSGNITIAAGTPVVGKWPVEKSTGGGTDTIKINSSSAALTYDGAGNANWDYTTNVNKTLSVTTAIGSLFLEITNDFDGAVGVIYITNTSGGSVEFNLPGTLINNVSSPSTVPDTLLNGEKYLMSYVRLGNTRFWNASKRN